MEQPIELLGVGGPESDDESESSFRVERSSVVRRGSEHPTRLLIIGAGVLALVAAIVLLGSPASDTSQSAPPTTAPTTSMPGATSDTSTTAGFRAPQAVPVAPEARGITLVAGRGDEKVFIALDSGQRMVVDVAGIPVAAAEGHVALAPDPEQIADDELCWFSIADRACRTAPPTGDEGATITQLAVDDVRQLRATSADSRWAAGWRAGQLVVTDQDTGEIHVVPEVRRTYFEDSVALIG